MAGDRLYEAIEFILNEATENELEVIRAALKRRVEGSDVRGAMGINPERLAREAASNIREQMGFSIENIRKVAANFAAEVIRKNAPELSQEQIDELLKAWVGGEPDQARTPTEPGPTNRGAPIEKGKIPAEALLAMVAQFVAYSTDAMSINEQVKLREQIPDWQRTYWNHFPPRIRQLTSLLLNGELDIESFWDRTYGELGLERGIR